MCLNPSPVSQHALIRDTSCTQRVCADKTSAIDAFARQKTSADYPTQKPHPHVLVKAQAMLFEMSRIRTRFGELRTVCA